MKTIIKKDPIVTWANPADITYRTVLRATQLNATADAPRTFVYPVRLRFCALVVYNSEG